jgi:ligand-binding sensor domain-containing protein
MNHLFCKQSACYGLRILGLLLMAISLFGCEVSEQQDPADISEGKWDHQLSTNSDLDYESVSTITKDDEGTMWAGTANGVMRFDSPGWTTYDISNSRLPTDNITALDFYNGNLWIGTSDPLNSGGLVHYDGERWTPYAPNNSKLPGEVITVVTIDQAGKKWIGCNDVPGLNGKPSTGGVITIQDGNWTTYLHESSGLPWLGVRAIAVDEAGTAWIGTSGKGMAKFDGNEWKVFNKENSGLPGDHVHAIAIEDDGRKWIGTDEEGLASFDQGSWTTYSKSNSELPSNKINTIAIDSANNKWVATHEGVAKYNGSQWTVLTEHNSQLPDDHVTDFAFADSGNLWITTRGGIGILLNPFGIS